LLINVFEVINYTSNKKKKIIINNININN